MYFSIIVAKGSVIVHSPGDSRDTVAVHVAVVTPIPTPYRDPFWNVFASLADVELDVFYCAEGKADRPWKTDWQTSFRSKVLTGWNLNTHRAESSLYWNREIYRALLPRYDALIIGGYNHLTMHAAMRIGRRRGTPYFLMCETYERRNITSLSARAKDRIVRRVVRHAAGGLATGKLATQYLAHYGLPEDRQFCLPNVPDIKRIAMQVAEFRIAQDANESAGNAPKQILYVGRLIDNKRVGDLIDAFHQIARSMAVNLVIVGDGPLRSELEAKVAALGLQQHVRFPGFVQPRDTAKYYAQADLFVLPSDETWGVAALEALAAGCPVVLSDKVGCHCDVLDGSRFGMSFQFGNVDALRAAITHTLRTLKPFNGSLLPDDWSYESLATRLFAWLKASILSNKGDSRYRSQLA